MGGQTVLPELLRRQVVARPRAPAILHGTRSWTYAALWNLARRLQRRLQEAGVSRGDRVCLYLENSAEYAAAYYAVLMVGGVVVALNSASRVSELERWVLHSGASALLFDPRLAESGKLVERLPGEVIRLELPAEDPEAYATEASDASSSFTLDAEALAAIIYTSGTTGEPKGVMLSHRNLYANVRAIVRYLELTPEDRVLNVLPFHYSYGNSVLHTHLASGASLVLENSFVFPQRVMERLAETRATGFSGVPATFALLLGRVRLEELDLSSLRYVTQAGGPMPPGRIREFLERVPGVRFFVMYGQTEATARITWLPPERLEEKPGSIGIPVEGVEVEIRGEDGRPCPPRVTGELFVRGPNVMMGYWRAPETTAGVLIDGWLRTGDLGWRDEEGYLYLEGRRSDIIKTGAYRVSPREIEEIVEMLPQVQEAAAVGMPDDLLGETIRIVIVPRPGEALDRRTVLAHCREHLPMYKLPREVLFVDSLPRTASGKIRRFLLRELQADFGNDTTRENGHER